MPIPKYNEMYNSLLYVLSDGKEHTSADLKKQVISDFKLTDDDLTEMLPSGKQSVFDNRVGWSKTYLNKAGLLASLSRGRFIITEEGKRLYDKEKNISNEILKNFSSFNEFKYRNSDTKENSSKSNSKPSHDVFNDEETPQETLERVYGEFNSVLIDEILAKIHKNSPAFFEKLVVELMEKMGYGRGEVTQLSRDEGIDGIVYQDKLGFDIIYVQAKRYEPDKTVGRPELQKFIGALPQQNAKGLFVITAKFSNEAKQYAKDRHIILIDGKKLAQLMIDHDYGVSTEYIYKVKKIDNDLFDEDE